MTPTHDGKPLPPTLGAGHPALREGDAEPVLDPADESHVDDLAFEPDPSTDDLGEAEAELEPPVDTVTHESGNEPTLGLPDLVELAAASDAANESERESTMYTAKFWKSVGERSVKTFAQTMVAAMGVTSTGLVGGLNWSEIGTLAVGAAIASVLTSLAGLSGPQKDANADA